MSNNIRFAKTFDVYGFRAIPDPIDPTKKNYEAYCNVHNLPDDFWTKVNPRNFKVSTTVSQKIAASLETNPLNFHKLNKGLTVTVKEVIVKKNRIRPGENQQSYSLTLVFTDEDKHGVGDGNHTYQICLLNRDQLDGSDAFVKLRIETDIEDVSLFVEAQNTSLQVSEPSMLNHRKKFDTLKKALEGTVLDGKVAYTQHAPEPVPVERVIALLTMFIPHENAPTKAYNNTGACLKIFKSEKAEYEAIYDIVGDIIDLANNIERTFVDAGKSVNKHLLKMTDIQSTTKKGKQIYRPMSFDPDTKVPYALPRGYVVPIIGAFYQLLDPGTKKFKINPSAVWHQIGGYLVAQMMGFRDELKANSAGIGKSSLVWDSMNNALNSALRKKNINV